MNQSEITAALVFGGGEGGGGGTTNYNLLSNKPKINSVELSGNKSLDDLGIVGTSLVGFANGVAELDVNGKVPASELPSFVDDVIEGYLHDSKFYEDDAYTTEIPGETGKIYVDLSNNKTYRWSGSAFVEISESLALGETSSTAFRGDHGKTAYDDSQTNKTNIGTMSNLSTTDKSSLVAAINEVKSLAGGGLYFSTTEEMVGQWIDGKPLYQKTIETTFTNGTATITDVSALNIDNLVDYFGYYHESGGICGHIPYGEGGTSFVYVLLSANKQTLNWHVGTGSWLTNDSAVLTIRYTKTTDTV